jgi:hypothetical protein
VKKRRKPSKMTPARMHQFRRFRAKGLFAAAITSFRDISEDKKNFTDQERITAFEITNMCKNRIDNWKNVLNEEGSAS